MKDGFVAGLAAADETARKQLGSMTRRSVDAAKAIASIVKTAVKTKAQVPNDEQLADKNARLDDGKATERFGAVRVLIPGINSLSCESEKRIE